MPYQFSAFEMDLGTFICSKILLMNILTILGEIFILVSNKVHFFIAQIDVVKEYNREYKKV